jgi:fructosamine-3-kinase
MECIVLSTIELETILGEKITQQINISTGVNQTYQITTPNNNYFIKYSQNDNLINEAYELELLAKYCNAPKVLSKSNNYLLLEWLEVTHNANSAKQIADNLINLHATKGNYFGFEFDNKIGLTRQLNPKMDNWADFYWNYRLLYQINLAKDNHLINANEYQNLLSLKPIVYQALDITITPILLHGDLWSGNVLSNQHQVYFIDSAMYYGHSEVDLALTFMFGGFDTDFYQQYFAMLPKQQGFETRKYIYMLYHYLNHLNIFGRSYHNSTINCANNISKLC